jgi:hypothetical protein
MPQPASTDNSGCLILFGGMFAAFGFVFLAYGLAFRQFDRPQTGLLLVSLTFMVAGIAVAAIGKSGGRTAALSRKLAAQNPDKPWLWREDWAGGYTDPEWRSTAVLWGAMGVIFLVVGGPSLMAIPQNWHNSHRYETLLVLLFPLAGLYLLSVSARATRSESKFRKTRLKLSRLPGVIGGRVEGNLETAYVFPPGTQMKFTLSCVRSYVSGDGHSRWENALWQETQVAPAYAGGPGSAVPVAFTTPYDARETDGRNPSDEIFWKLTAHAAVAGLDFHADFRLPVFKTADSDANLTLEKLNERSEAQLAGRRPAEAKITEQASADGGVQFHLGPGRNKGTAAGFALFGLIFLGGGAFFGTLFGRGFTWFLGAIPLLICGLIGLGLLAFGTWMLLGQTTVGVVNRSLRIHSSCLGFSRTRVVEAAAIRQMELYPGMRSADRIWYDLRIRLEKGETVTAGSAMEKGEAEWFLGEIRKDLGMQEAG